MGSRLLAGLAERAPGLISGADAEGIAFLDVDDSIREVHGYAKQAAGYGYTGVRGLNFQVAALSTPTAAPVIAAARLRRGNTAHFCHAFVSAALRAKIWFSVTARMNKQVTAAIAAIPDDAWTPIQYPPTTPAWKGKPGSVQEELFATYRHHGFITNSTLSAIEADQRHRDHAIVEQVIAELKDGPIAHLPSGS